MGLQYLNPSEQALSDYYKQQRSAQEIYGANASQDVAERLGGIRKNWPNLDPGAALAFANGGYKADDEIVRKAAEAQIGVNKKRRKSLWQQTYGAAKGVLRAAGDVASYVPQELYGAVRTEAHNIREYGVLGSISEPFFNDQANINAVQAQTNLGQIQKAHLEGRRVDTGSGLFTNPESEIGKAQSQAARDAWAVDGHAWTLGRGIAGTITEPGSLGYKTLSGIVDATVSWKADPAGAALGNLGRVRQAQKTFGVETVDPGWYGVAKGLVNGTRQTTLPELADEFLSSQDGVELIDRISKTGNFHDLYRAMNRKPSVELVKSLADETNPTAIKDILRNAIADGEVTNKRIGGLGYRINKKYEDRLPTTLARFAAHTPDRAFQLNDPNQVIDLMEKNLINARMSSQQVSDWVNEAAKATTNAERGQVVLNSYEAIKNHLINQYNIPSQMANALTRFSKDHNPGLRAYFVDEIGNNVPVLGAKVDTIDIASPVPHLLVEHLDDEVANLNYKDIREATAFLKPITDFLEENHAGWTVKSVKGLARGTRALTQGWIVPTLLRPAWTVKVIGEEQVRIAASGQASLFNHPAQALAWVVGEDKKVLGKTFKSTGDTDIVGNEFKAALNDRLSEFSQALVKRGESPWRDKLEASGFVNNISRPEHTTYLYRSSNKKYEKGLVEELGQLRSDPVAQRLAGGWRDGDRVPGGLTGNDLEDAKRWFFEGPGQKFRDQLIGWDHPELSVKANSDAYVASVFDRVNIKTGGVAPLREFIATGKMDGQLIDQTGNVGQYGKELEKRLGSLLEDPNIHEMLPMGVKASFAAVTGAKKNTLDEIIDFGFDNLMSKPSNYLSRSNRFRQSYWKEHVPRLMGSMTPEAQAQVIAQAEKANIGSKTIALLRDQAKKSSGKLDLEHADFLAKGASLDDTQKLLYDLSDRNQFFDVAKAIFPFGDAWKEIMTTWFGPSGIVSKNPAVLRRGQQILEGARGSGFFYKDEQSGKEMYAMPVPGLDHLMGAQFQAPVQGLNLFSSNPVMPGIGPVFQWPVSAVIPDKPQFDWARNALTPAGSPDTSLGLVESFAPSWLKKALTALEDPESNRSMNNAVESVARYKLSSGKYSIETPNDQARLLDDSKPLARGLFILRALVQSGAPSAPQVKWMAKDKDGKMVTAQYLQSDFQDILNASNGNYDDAVSKFIDSHGEGALLYMQGMSDGEFQPLDSLHDFVRTNSDFALKYKKVYGFFSPKGGEFSGPELERQLAAGERKTINPNDFLKLGNSRVASMIYKKAREVVGEKPSAAQREILSQLQDLLAKKYDGYQPDEKVFGKTKSAIRQLEEAVQDRSVAGLPVTKAISTYLKARSIVESRDENFTSTRRAAQQRELLRQIGQQLSIDTPEFTDVWQRLFSKEIGDA